jgi:hypothetical protein
MGEEVMQACSPFPRGIDCVLAAALYPTGCNGALLTNDHTVLISHTANGILTNLTGVYPDRHGQAVANSYRYFSASRSTAASAAAFVMATHMPNPTSYRMSRVAITAFSACSEPST